LRARLDEYDVLITAADDRLGRDAIRTTLIVYDLLAAGIEIHYYLTGVVQRELAAEQRMMALMRGVIAEQECERASLRTRDALLRRAERGFVAGGIVYGYNNVPVLTQNLAGDEVRQYTDYQVNGYEASVLRAMFQMYADGYGLKAIAKTLNGDERYAAENRKYFQGDRVAPPLVRAQAVGRRPESEKCCIGNVIAVAFLMGNTANAIAAAPRFASRKKAGSQWRGQSCVSSLKHCGIPYRQG
jgi:hypothetical protein